MQSAFNASTQNIFPLRQNMCQKYQCASNKLLLPTSFALTSFRDKFNRGNHAVISTLYRSCMYVHSWGVTHSSSTSDWFTFSISLKADAPRSEIPFPWRLKMRQCLKICRLKDVHLTLESSVTASTWAYYPTHGSHHDSAYRWHKRQQCAQDLCKLQ